jgi:hypothetical protein
MWFLLVLRPCGHGYRYLESWKSLVPTVPIRAMMRAAFALSHDQCRKLKLYVCLIVDCVPQWQTKAAIDCRWYRAAHDESVGLVDGQSNSEVTIRDESLVMAVQAPPKLSAHQQLVDLVKELVSSATAKLHSASRSLISMCISALPTSAPLLALPVSTVRPFACAMSYYRPVKPVNPSRDTDMTPGGTQVQHCKEANPRRPPEVPTRLGRVPSHGRYQSSHRVVDIFSLSLSRSQSAAMHPWLRTSRPWRPCSESPS